MHCRTCDGRARHATLSLMLACASCVCFAQSDDATTPLGRALATASHDSVRFDLLLSAAGERLGADPDSAMVLCERARSLAPTTGRPSDFGEVEGWLGYVAEQRGRIDEALEHYARSLAEIERLHDRKGASVVLNNLAAIYKDQGRLEESLAAHQRSLVLRKELCDTSGIATSINNIGLLYYDQGRIPEAMENYAEALRLYERMGDQEGIATALHNIAGVYRDQGDHAEALAHLQRVLEVHATNGNVYSMASAEDNIGGVFEDLGRTHEALTHYEKALVLHDSVSDPRGMGYSLRNISSLRLRNGDAQGALDAAERSLSMLDAAGDKRGSASALWAMGEALEQLGRTEEAMQHGKASLTKARELGYPALIRDAAKLLGRLHRSRKQWPQALMMQDLYFQMRDSVRNEEARRSSVRQQYRYAYERKEADLKAEQIRRDGLARESLQKERNKRNVGVFVGFGLWLVAAGLWSRLRYMRNSRAAIQQEKNISEGLLLNILPEEVAGELKAKGEADAKQIEQVTVLFTDFKGFTEMSEKLTPKELVADIHECFSAFDHIMAKHGIEKIKTIGDAYMAAGGLPTPNNTHALDVVKAALEIRDFIAEGKARKVAAGLPYFEIRIGIHTGPVVAGIVGVKKFAYDIWGDTVNTASRMESSGEVGQVNISEATYALVKDEPWLSFTPRGKVQAKGKGEMEMYFASSNSELHDLESPLA
ncbi:MAG: tetratricopeptide repeat protein [Flavobacteriales bacterium]|nr:tetratricopeptide repeat protein [Flavobacteriales bacterium]